MSEINIIDASLRFRIYRNPSPGLKESFVHSFRKA